MISRRGFLKGVGTAAVAAGIGATALLNKQWLMEHLNYLNVKIIEPVPDTSLTIGQPIKELEAEAEGPKGEIFDIDEFVDFSWYIRQENTDWVRIHDERKGESEEIPTEKFSPGPAELAVVIRDKKGLKKQAKIEIKLKDVDISDQALQVVGVNPSALGVSVYDFYRLVYSDFDDSRNPLAYGELPKKTEEEIKRGIKLRDQLETKYGAYFYKANIAKTTMNNWYPILGGNDQVKRESFVPKAHEALDIFAQEGSLVYSPLNGIVIASGDFWKGRYDKDLVYKGGGLTPKAGNAIVIYNPEEHGYMWIAHLQEGLLVKTGDIVTRGQILGKVGNSGSASKPGHGKHVHVAYKIESNKSGLAYRTLEGINFYDRLYRTKQELIASNFNILLIGSDLMLGRGNIGERGDSLTFISTDTINKAIRVVSIPRDTYAFFSNKRKYDKINHALAFGGWQLQKSVVEEFLNVKVNKVIFLDLQNATSILNVIRKEFGNDVIKEVFGRIGLVNSIGFTYDTIRDFISNRNMPEAAVGRGKHHAIILRGCIELCIHYYRDPRKKDVFFNEQHISNLLKMVKYTDLTAKEFISLVGDWAKNDCSIQVYVIPGREQKINKISYWVPDTISGNEDYFTKVVSYRKSRVG